MNFLDTHADRFTLYHYKPYLLSADRGEHISKVFFYICTAFNEQVQKQNNKKEEND